jgi:hypothetical protein
MAAVVVFVQGTYHKGVILIKQGPLQQLQHIMPVRVLLTLLVA